MQVFEEENANLFVILFIKDLLFAQGCGRKFGMEKPIDFWLRTGKAGGEPKPTETFSVEQAASEITTNIWNMQGFE